MPAKAATISRRHDLDALRAIAMLLGIALHGALAYMPLPAEAWPVQDIRQSGSFAVFMSAVHGFRMPLFFLISGFFTAMLWRKRGLRALLIHRFKRIFLPLAIGMFTIVPAVWIVSIVAGITASLGADSNRDDNLWSAVSAGDVEGIAKYLDEGADPNEPEPASGATPIAIAAVYGHAEAVELLISAGADVNERNRDGGLPLHGAAFFGRAEACRVLIEQGADVNAKNYSGETAADTLKADWATTQIIASLVQVEVDQREVVEGRKEVALLLQAAGPTLQSQPEQLADREHGDDVLSGVLTLLMLFPFFHHLWFLAFLCWLVLAFALYAKVTDLIGWKAPKWLVVSPLRYAWLIPLTLVPQSMMGLLYPNFGPDTSAGILPMPWVLLYYAIFFFFGALYFDCDDATGRVGRWWGGDASCRAPRCLPVGVRVNRRRLRPRT